MIRDNEWRKFHLVGFKKFNLQSAQQFSNKAMHFGLGAHDQGARGDGETRLWPEYWIPFQCLRLFPFHETTNSCFIYLKGIFGKKQTCNDAKYLKQLNKSFWYLFKNILLWIVFVELLVYCWNGYQFLMTYVSPCLGDINYNKKRGRYIH